MGLYPGRRFGLQGKIQERGSVRRAGSAQRWRGSAACEAGRYDRTHKQARSYHATSNWAHWAGYKKKLRSVPNTNALQRDDRAAQVRAMSSRAALLSTESDGLRLRPAMLDVALHDGSIVRWRLRCAVVWRH